MSHECQRLHGGSLGAGRWAGSLPLGGTAQAAVQCGSGSVFRGFSVTRPAGHCEASF